jgi:hypothetical protein
MLSGGLVVFWSLAVEGFRILVLARLMTVCVVISVAMAMLLNNFGPCSMLCLCVFTSYFSVS